MARAEAALKRSRNIDGIGIGLLTSPWGRSSSCWSGASGRTGSTRAFEKIYLISGAMLLVALPLLFMFRTGKPQKKGQGPAMHAE